MKIVSEYVVNMRSNLSWMVLMLQLFGSHPGSCDAHVHMHVRMHQKPSAGRTQVGCLKVATLLIYWK